MANIRNILQHDYPIKTIIRWAWLHAAGHRTLVGACTFLGIASVLLGFAFVWITKLCIDAATGSHTGITLTEAAVGLTALALLQTALSAIHLQIRSNLSVRFQNHLQRRLFNRLLFSEHVSSDNLHSGDIINRLGKDVSEIAVFIVQTFPAFLTTLLQLLGAFIFLFWLNSTLGIILLLIFPFFLLLSRYYVFKMRGLTHDIRNSDSLIQSLLQESTQHRVIIKTLNRGGLMLDKLTGQHDLLQQLVKRKTRFSLRASTLLNLGFSAGYLVTFIWGAFQLQKGLITYGSLMAFIQLVGQIQGPARSLSHFIPLHINALTAADRLMQLEDHPLEPQGELRMKGPIGIACENVCFNYPGGTPVLESFSHVFAPGSCTGIVGETGCGKTTLIRLLLAIRKANSGNTYLFDGTRREAISPLTRVNFSYVPQGNTLFSGTVRDNLLMGRPDANEREMEWALRTACADFVFEKPLQLDTPCFELGGGLSEGQAQRICIARALLQEGNILLLDEATSALDPQTETMVLENIAKTCKDRTILFITHREKALTHCDAILNLAAERRRGCVS